MATTSPDTLRTPNPTDPYNLVSDMAVLATDVQTALTRRANTYVGTASQRTAFTTAVEGVHWQDTDGDKGLYARQGGLWMPQGIRAFSGTAAQRTAFTNAPNGSQWIDTDGTNLEYRRIAGAWVGGSTTITPSSGTTISGSSVTRVGNIVTLIARFDRTATIGNAQVLGQLASSAFYPSVVWALPGSVAVSAASSASLRVGTDGALSYVGTSSSLTFWASCQYALSA